MLDTPIDREELAELRRRVNELESKLIKQNTELSCRLIRIETTGEFLGAIFNPFAVGIAIVLVMWAFLQLAWLAGQASVK